MQEGVAGCVRAREDTGYDSRKSYWDIVRSVDEAKTVEGADDGANEIDRKGRSDAVTVFVQMPCSKSHDLTVESKPQLYAVFSSSNTALETRAVCDLSTVSGAFLLGLFSSIFLRFFSLQSRRQEPRQLPAPGYPIGQRDRPRTPLGPEIQPSLRRRRKAARCADEVRREVLFCG